LRNQLHANEGEMTDFNNFFKVIVREEKRMFGFNYCDESWIGYFGKEKNYDTKKGCGVQKTKIQDKIFTFEDDTMPKGIFGIWDLKKNKNIMTNIPIDPIEVNGQKFYFFSEIMKFLELAYEAPMNVLDCSCSGIYDQNDEQIKNARLQRRLQRQIISPPITGFKTKNGGTKKIKNKKSKNIRKNRKSKNIRKNKKSRKNSKSRKNKKSKK
jgi:hypothetical protein